MSQRAFPDLGLLVLRVGLGIWFMFHGWPKLIGGAATWTKLGASMETFGITFAPAAWGFAAAAAEFVGGILLAFGVLYRPTVASLAFTMFVAMSWHIAKGDPFSSFAHSGKMLTVFVAMFLIGPGRFALHLRRG